jgi:hypothetical protein
MTFDGIFIDIVFIGMDFSAWLCNSRCIQCRQIITVGNMGGGYYLQLAAHTLACLETQFIIVHLDPSNPFLIY